MEVGRIIDAYGIKGWLRVQPYASDPQALFSSRRWFLLPSEKPQQPAAVTAAKAIIPPVLRITDAREQGDGIVERGAVEPELLGRALDNLLRNALQHAPRESRVEVALTTSKSEVLIHVRDEGEGVPAGAEERIFVPFHRERRAGQGGAGLGLALVREVAERHGGRARAIPSPRGAWFEIALPLTRD